MGPKPAQHSIIANDIDISFEPEFETPENRDIAEVVAARRRGESQPDLDFDDVVANLGFDVSDVAPR
jgi:hypothetical protein